jgi:hypothetical protein
MIKLNKIWYNFKPKISRNYKSLKDLIRKIVLNYLIFFITLFVMFSFEKIDYLNFYNLSYSVILSSLFQSLYDTYNKYKNN